MRINWDSPYTPYTHGYRCDNCGLEADTEMHNSCWFQIQSMGPRWDACSKECVTAMDLDSTPPREDPNYIGGKSEK